jgi:DNA-binding transcriptional MerR regulator
MNIGEVSEWVGVSRSTVRKYLTDFSDIEGGFSQSALPGPGKHRRFTDRDVAILSWISQQYNEYHLSYEEIQTALATRINNGEEFVTPERPDEAETLALIPREQYEEVLAAHKRELERAIAERDAAMSILDREREATMREIAKLNHKIGRLTEKVLQLGGDPDVD